MSQITDINTLREQLLYKIKHSSPKVLELFYNFIEIIEGTNKDKVDKDEHPLLKSFGVIDEESGQAMIDCINNEFNNIEGEW